MKPRAWFGTDPDQNETGAHPYNEQAAIMSSLMKACNVLSLHIPQICGRTRFVKLFGKAS